MKQIIYVLFLVFVSQACMPPTSGTSSVITAIEVGNYDAVYQPGIETVRLYLNQQRKEDQLNFPVIGLNDVVSELTVEFDDFNAEYQNYFMKLVPCNADWSTAVLNDLEFLENFNEVLITDWQISINTRKTYYHYKANVPKPKLSGNYVLKVFKNSNLSDIIFTRRFMVVEKAAMVQFDIKFPLDVSKRFAGQQVDFMVNYGGLSDIIYNPADVVKVVVRQNGRWDNAIYGLRPQYIRDEDKKLDYHFFNNENLFDGGSEWRTADLRSMRFNGQGVEATRFTDTKAEVLLERDVSRNRKSYNQWIDINGRYAIENFETREGSARGDYMFTNFRLDAPTPINGDIYVYGQLSDFQLKPAYKMIYDSSQKAYTNKLFLKQGFYNYQYVLKRADNPKPDFIFFEGSYSQTENIYDIVVYFRQIGARYDRIIGYGSSNYFGR